MEVTRSEAAHEYASFECHGLVAHAPFGTVVAPAKPHVVLIEHDKTLAGDSDTVL
ncbi:hypothetical protein GXB81_06760 [Paraburkholderia sp. Ac-20336]|nr:hypothetical protein [Paraburkholderia sp. Ac-20336]MBN3849964.1 hypothetical protein [Paraburkholderia sp. Ac-20342]